MLETIIGVMFSLVKILGLTVLAGCGLLCVLMITLIIVRLIRDNK